MRKRGNNNERISMVPKSSGWNIRDLFNNEFVELR